MTRFSFSPLAFLDSMKGPRLYRNPNVDNIKRAQDMLCALYKRDGLPRPDATQLARFADSFVMAWGYGFISSSDANGLNEVEARVELRLSCNATETDDLSYCSCGDCYHDKHGNVVR